MPSSSIKNEKMYQDLRKEGNSKEKAARISHAAARGKSAVGKKGGESGSYDDWAMPELSLDPPTGLAERAGVSRS